MDKMPFDRSKTPFEHHNFRSQAELEVAKAQTLKPSLTVPVEKLLHELQVHQIELEMQNEELRRAHTALEESRDRYLDLFEFAPIGYFTLSAEGLIIEVNFVGAALLGDERKKLLLKPFSRYIAREFSDTYHLHMARLKHQDDQQSYELQIKREDGELRYVHVGAIRMATDDGVSKFRITLTDISVNKRVEEAKDYLDNLIKHANGPIVVWDASGRITKVNQSVERLTGLSADEIVGQSIDALFSAQEVEKIQVAIKGENLKSVDIPVQHKSGVVRIVSWNSANIYLADAKTVRATIAQGVDITDRKQAERDLLIAATAFEAQEGMIVTDEHRFIVRVNNAFTRLTGYSAEDAVGRPASMLRSGLHDEAFYQGVWDSINRDRYWQGEIWDKRKSGEVFPGLMTITAVLGAEGRITNYVITFLDITLQKQAEKVLLDARKHLEEQVEQAVMELNHLKEESGEVSTALKVMIKLRETESSDAKNLLILELKQEVMPFLQRLKKGSRDPKQVRLLSTLDANLQRLITSYGCATSITSAYRNLTPKEIQVASMVREGFSTKVIAATLSLSPETISIHRKNIRKKLGLDSKADNLRSYLITLDR